jgi:rRNA maturation protein Nop10
MRHIHKCAKCGTYTMKPACSCGTITSPARPLKYSTDDKLAGYRRKAKYGEYAGMGFL